MNMKKIAAVLLASIIMSTGMATYAAEDFSGGRQNSLSNFIKTTTYDNTFTDISGHWANENIVSACEYGVISGVGGGLYSPEGRLTVAQAIIIAARLHMTYKYSEEGQSVLDGYASDTASEHWAAPFVTYAVGEGLIDSEWGDVLDKPVTRAEAIRLWSRILKEKDMASINTVNKLPDVNLSTQYSAEITLFYEAGIVRGSTINGEPNSFNPDGTLSRAEAATILMMLMEADKRISGRTYGDKSVRTLAGTGTSSFSDEKTATASFTLPNGFTVDDNGRIIVFDTYNNALRLINSGRIETLAGKWIAGDESRFSRGYYRDGALSQALFNRPTGGVAGTNGDLFVCDSENHVIRQIKDGKVYTFAGTTAGYADGAGNAAKFNTPTAIAMDKSGNLYVADTMNNCIRKLDAKGNVTTVAGTPGKSGYTNGNADVSLFRNPMGIAVNEDGSVIYVADTGNHKIRKIENGYVTTLSGVTTETDEDGDPAGGYQDGVAGDAMFNLPKGLTLAEDMLFVADSGNNAIRAVNMSGYVFTAAGTGAPGDREGGTLTAEFNQPAGVLWHKGVLYIADTANNMIKTLAVDMSRFKEAE